MGVAVPMGLSTLETQLSEAACLMRGAVDAPKFKDYILPLIFLKRLSDVFEDEVAHLAHEFGDVRTAARLVEQGTPSWCGSISRLKPGGMPSAGAPEVRAST